MTTRDMRMNFEEYRKLDGLALAALVERGEVTPGELLELAIARAEQVNPALNGLILPLYEQARRRAAGRLSGPFAGVPMLVKDLFQEMDGVPHAMGNRALKQLGYRATADSELVRRWQAAGVVIMGRTNTPEFGAKGITEPLAWGATRNPWDTERTPGGSSGGSAALVAAGVVPFAGANDGGGSIRIPAACCGLFGLKPGRGRTPWGPQFTEAMHGMSINHVVTRSVRDSAALLDATHGDEPGAMFRLAPPERPYLEEVQREPGKLRIGYSVRSPIGTPVHEEAERAVQNAVRLLVSLGHEVEEAEPEIDGEQMTADWLQMWFSHCAATVDLVRQQTGCDDDGFEPDTLVMAAFGRSIRANEYVENYQRWQLYTQQLAAFMQRYDFWLTPTLAMPPAKIGELATPAWQQTAARLVMKVGASRLVLKSGMLEKMARENLRYTPFTQVGNVTGVPAMSVPLHWCANGLPMGVQFIGYHGDEGKLLRLAAQLEQASPWMARVPAI
ncbi:amidase [Alcanivorax quisquiliarum]|uniref:Amidase n=1 Tax=Alcanivorax quisquiliarum TaxID=2933565 RepID=A0ABT0E702_9GAMM|nr:amidase [Alcanivorax quisquiliarum]MCK0537620.1 amidase [Alcanivorax quisquiliarum]